MTPELQQAITERINLGYSFEQIQTEMLAAGYDAQLIRELYNQATQAPVASSKSEVLLPAATTALKDGLSFAWQRPQWLLLLTVPMVALTLLEFYQQQYTPSSFATSTTIALLFVGVFVVNVLHIVAALYMTAQASHQTVTYSQGVRWAGRNFLSLIWVQILAAAVILGGFLLLILPALILSVYLYFTQFAFVVEQKRGFAALTRSYQLVRGHWFAVAGFLLLIGVLLLILFIAIGILFGTFSAFTTQEHIALLLVDLLFAFLGALATLVMLHVGMTVFTRLAQAAPAGVPEKQPAILPVFAGLGVLFLGLFGVLVYIGLQYDGVLENDSFAESAALQIQLSQVSAEAELIFLETGGYEAVCAVAEPLLRNAEEVTCNANATQYAVVAELAGQLWCVDHTGYEKKIASHQDDRTTCLPTVLFDEADSIEAVEVIEESI